jgi:membrane protease subunit (stomatin/prohibitin family)
MALLGREFIAVPDSHKGQIVYKWPDASIRRFTRAIVNADEVALFVNTGQVVQTLGPGRHQIDADELPGLGILIDAATAGRAYRAELYFVGSREYTGFNFGGRVDDVQDPQTGLIVTLRVFGDYALRVIDPITLITNLVSTVDVTDNSKISNWVADQLLKVMRTDVTTQIVRNGWPILGLSAYTQDIEQNAIVKANEQLLPYGVAISRMGNFDINLSPEDQTQLKTLAKDTSYSRLAGSFNNYAAGELALGAGAGMAQGGAAVGGAFLAAGLGAGGMAVAGPAGSPPPQAGCAGGGAGGYQGPPPGGGAPAAIGGGAPAAGGVTCSNCSATNPAGAKFCSTCGTPVVAAGPAHCMGCGSELVPGARFCASCGTPAGAAPQAAIPSAPPATPPAPPEVPPPPA